MYAHILVPVLLDDSRDVEGAADFARKATKNGGRITFLHVIEPTPALVEAHIPGGLMLDSRDYAKSRLEDAAASTPNAQIALAHGSAGRSITDWAENNGVDCIAIASHRPALSDVLLGSTAAWVVRHAQCAVHVLR